MKVIVLSASPRKNSNTQIMMKFVYDYTKSKNEDTKFINLAEDQIECYRGPVESYNESTVQAAKDITEADVWLLGTPIYNSFFSSSFKNIFEYINYKKTAGKVAGMAIMASGSIGFTDVQTLVTQLMSYDIVFSNDKFTQSLYQKRKKQVISVPLKNRESLSGTLIRSKIANNQNWEESIPNGARKILQKISTKERLEVFNYK